MAEIIRPDRGRDLASGLCLIDSPSGMVVLDGRAAARHADGFDGLDERHLLVGVGRTVSMDDVIWTQKT